MGFSESKDAESSLLIAETQRTVCFQPQQNPSCRFACGVDFRFRPAKSQILLPDA